MDQINRIAPVFNATIIRAGRMLAMGLMAIEGNACAVLEGQLDEVQMIVDYENGIMPHHLTSAETKLAACAALRHDYPDESEEVDPGTERYGSLRDEVAAFRES